TANKGAEIIEGGLILEAFGTGVPEEIQKSLNIDETNLQMQLDAPFLISKSPGEVSTYFNKIAHLDQIDTSLKAINKEYHTLNSKKGHDETQVEELQVDLASFDYLEKFEIELEVLEERQSQRKQYWASVQNLKTVIKEIEEIDAGIAKKQLTIAFEKSVNKLLAMWTEADKKVKEASELEDTLKELSDIENETVELKRKVKLLPQVVRLLVMWDKERSLAKEIREFRRTGREIKEVNSAIEKIDKKIEKLETKFHKLMPEICPLCGK
ncbi:MAG: hypothetical protein KAS32_03900, partial [Candidatus Peribacteraceae bacterium]|nr:hypothetical protein [Candidatus Peribacteraceae bacterium]